MRFLTLITTALISFGLYADYYLVSTEPNYDNTRLSSKDITAEAIQKAKTKLFCIDGDIKTAFDEKKDELKNGYSHLYYIGGYNFGESIDVVFNDSRNQIIIKVSAKPCLNYRREYEDSEPLGVECVKYDEVAELKDEFIIPACHYMKNHTKSDQIMTYWMYDSY